MFLPRLRTTVSSRGTPSLVAYLHTTRPIAADFASRGKTASPGAKLAADTTSTTTIDHPYTYTKQQDVTPEPRMSHTGTRTYVVSPKDDTAPYDVPGGAYGSSDPYLTPPRTPAPQTSAPSSTSSSGAHPNTTLRVPHYPEGVGESAAVRFRWVLLSLYTIPYFSAFTLFLLALFPLTSTAPGAMHTRGGSDGGLGLMDTSHPSDAPRTLAQRNLPPSAEGGVAGNSEAWKYRR